MSNTPIFELPAPVLKDESNPKWTFHYVPVPPDIAEQLMASGTRRVILEVNGTRANRSIHRNADGEFRLIIGLVTLRDLGVRPGDVLVATLRSDPDPDSVDVPDEFEEAMDEHPEARKRFESWTPGKRRSLVTYITQAKRPETRIRRAYELAHKLETYTLYGDTHPTD